MSRVPPGEEESGFLSRWSKRKQRSRLEPPSERDPSERDPGERDPSERDPGERDPAEAESADAATAEQELAQGGAPGELSEEQIAALPDPDTLGPGDDFRPFLQRGVPEMLKRRALRRLWSSNPLFNFRDGLNEYDEDYTDAATVVANLQTLFQPGKGMPQPERWRKPEKPAEEQVAGGADAAADPAGPQDEAATDAEGEADDAPAPEASAEPERAPAAGADPAGPDPAGRDPAGPDSERQAMSPAVSPRLRRPAAQRRWAAFAVDEEEPGDVPVKR